MWALALAASLPAAASGSLGPGSGAWVSGKPEDHGILSSQRPSLSLSLQLGRAQLRAGRAERSARLTAG